MMLADLLPKLFRQTKVFSTEALPLQHAHTMAIILLLAAGSPIFSMGKCMVNNKVSGKDSASVPNLKCKKVS